MPRKVGKLIILDGLDGSGKATQTKLLLNRLKKEGYKTAVTDFPQYYSSFFGQMVGRYLSGEFGTAKQVNPYLASILYAGDRWQAKEKMAKWLKEGRIIISNRYVSANQIHQTAKIKGNKEKARFINWLDQLEFKIFGIPRPDLIIYLNVPYKIGQKLVIKKGSRKYMGGIKRDIHESSRSHLLAAHKQSLQLVKKNKNWKQVKCIQGNEILSRQEISRAVWEIVEKEV